ncbi:hypothetical protein AgCh_034891 [Apium graveolens]
MKPISSSSRRSDDISRNSENTFSGPELDSLPSLTNMVSRAQDYGSFGEGFGLTKAEGSYGVHSPTANEKMWETPHEAKLVSTPMSNSGWHCKWVWYEGVELSQERKADREQDCQARFPRFTLYVMSSALSLRSILDAHKLTGPNYADWLRNLRIVLRIEKLEYVIDSPKPTEPASDAHNDEHVVYRKWIDNANVAQCIMLASMNIELQKQHEHMDAHTILMHLQELYDVAGRTAQYEISKELFGCRMSEGSSVNDHVLKMINLIERLGQLGFAMDGELSQDLVLQSLPSSFSQFVVNFHMNKLDVSLPELHNMLKTAESNFPPKKSSVLLIGEGFNPKKRKRNPSKKKKVGEKTPVPPKAEDPKSKVVCFHCNKVGHWKRNCKIYLAELKNKKGSETTASDSGMFMIEGPRRSRTLEEEEVILLMGNGARVAAEDVESFHLHMPTGKTIV